MEIIWTWEASRDSIKGFRYLWLKTVEGFNPKLHCARCLKGSYSKQFSPQMPANTTITETYPEGTLLYFCGVASPYKWQDNLHLAGRVVAGAESSVVAYNGDVLTVNGLEQIAIDTALSLSQYGGTLGREFLTCRNFQFGAMLQTLK